MGISSLTPLLSRPHFTRFFFSLFFFQCQGGSPILDCVWTSFFFSLSLTLIFLRLLLFFDSLPDIQVCRVQISEFGHAGGLPFQEKKDKTAPRNYWAPERLLGGSNVDFSSDMWSIGCLLAELLERKVQFCGVGVPDIFRSITLLLGIPSHEVVKKVYRCPLGVCAEINAAERVEPTDFSKRFPKVSGGGMYSFFFVLCFLVCFSCLLLG